MGCRRYSRVPSVRTVEGKVLPVCQFEGRFLNSKESLHGAVPLPRNLVAMTLGGRVAQRFGCAVAQRAGLRETSCALPPEVSRLHFGLFNYPKNAFYLRVFRLQRPVVGPAPKCRFLSTTSEVRSPTETAGGNSADEGKCLKPEEVSFPVDIPLAVRVHGRCTVPFLPNLASRGSKQMRSVDNNGSHVWIGISLLLDFFPRAFSYCA